MKTIAPKILINLFIIKKIFFSKKKRFFKTFNYTKEQSLAVDVIENKRIKYLRFGYIERKRGVIIKI